MYVFWSVSFTIMQSLLVFCVIGLLFATDNGLVQGSISCTENCSIKEKDIQSSNPPLITEDRIAVLHSKCHSHCMNKVRINCHDVIVASCYCCHYAVGGKLQYKTITGLHCYTVCKLHLQLYAYSMM